jgi:hypothetical protein
MPNGYVLFLIKVPLHVDIRAAGAFEMVFFHELVPIRKHLLAFWS